MNSAVTKALAVAAFAILCAVSARAQGSVEMKCRPLPDQNAFLGPNETYVNGMACHRVKAADPDPAPAPAVSSAAADPAPPPSAAPAPDPVEPSIKRDGHLAWIDPASPYASYLEAAAQKKHVPVKFTIKKAYAGYFITLSAQERNGSAWRAIMTGESGRASALSMTVADATTGAVAFSYTCHKGGHAMFATGHEGFQSAAECLAKHWAGHVER